MFRPEFSRAIASGALLLALGGIATEAGGCTSLPEDPHIAQMSADSRFMFDFLYNDNDNAVQPSSQQCLAGTSYDNNTYPAWRSVNAQRTTNRTGQVVAYSDDDTYPTLIFNYPKPDKASRPLVPANKATEKIFKEHHCPTAYQTTA